MNFFIDYSVLLIVFLKTGCIHHGIKELNKREYEKGYNENCYSGDLCDP